MVFFLKTEGWLGPTPGQPASGAPGVSQVNLAANSRAAFRAREPQPVVGIATPDDPGPRSARRGRPLFMRALLRLYPVSHFGSV